VDLRGGNTIQNNTAGNISQSNAGGGTQTILGP
jgi:hypothetical protein